MTTTLDSAFDALLSFRLAEWNGLPPCLNTDLARSFGTPSEAVEVSLGAFPALRESYSAPNLPATGFMAYSRAHRVTVIETAAPPPLEVLETLGEPDARMPQEFSLPGYYVREFLFCRRGLVLSVAEPSGAAEPLVKIVRCRGIAVLNAPFEYGADYYLAHRNRILFPSP